MLRLKISLGFFSRIAMLAESLAQFPISRIAANQIRRVRLKKILQGELPLFLGQILCRFCRNLQKRILRRPCHIILNLGNQRWNKIEVLVNVREFVEQLHHAVIIFEGVHTHPRQAVLASHQILVKRLMLMPEKNQTQGGHWQKFQSSMGAPSSFHILQSAALPVH